MSDFNSPADCKTRTEAPVFKIGGCKNLLKRIEAAANSITGLVFAADCRDGSPDIMPTEFYSLNDDFFYVGIMSKIDFGMKAYLLIMTDMASADELTFALVGEHLNFMDDYKESAIQEFANILIGNLVSEISRTNGIRIDYTIPAVAVDYKPALADALMARALEGRVVSSHELKLTCKKPPIFLSIALIEVSG